MSDVEAANVALGIVCVLVGVLGVISQVATWRQP